MTDVRVLFVCMGNICRSPAAEGAFRALIAAEGLDEMIAVDSAGTISYHAGHAPDARMRSAAAARGIDLAGRMARQVRDNDFDAFDFILAMDRSNFDDLTAHSPAASQSKVQMFLDYAPDLGVDEVPDPYSGGPQGFEHVLDLVEAAAAGLFAHILEQYIRPNSPK